MHAERPNFKQIKSGEAFRKWYWLKEELIDICKDLKIPHTGKKFDLQDRIAFTLDYPNCTLPVKSQKKKTSTFNWAKADLNLETEITDNVSFGPNFRRFMKGQIGEQFSCHGDFMDWVRRNVGKTLEDAVDKWHELEKRKEDSNFKRDIAAHNMYNQYTRDFLEDNKGMTIQDAKRYWLIKKKQPTQNGFVRYERSDLDHLK